ncbi:hypothetical protein [Agromyces allii]|uniref:Uncharacterized protein n=1 Tax=Agromyces allii TaxID=393607 RepID=A0ABN2Q1B3_9MICO|nr:hypothetical protein [Agromyces allii]
MRAVDTAASNHDRPAIDPADTNSIARVRWYRRRAPADFDRFLRGVWWTGHGQLFIAAGLPVIAVIFVGVGVGFANREMTWCGVFALAMAVPFWYSGMLLRGTAGFLPPGPGRLNVFQWVERVVVLAIVVLTIAFIAIVGVIFAVFVIWQVVAAASVGLH